MSAKATILFAEDDQHLSLLVKEALEEEGYKVIHCADGQTAIDNFDKSKIDICLLDIMMPQKDGYAVAKKIRQLSDRVPILFLSTKAQETDRLKGYDTGADDYLTKPFSMPELLKKLDVFLRRTKKETSALPEVYAFNQIRLFPADMKIETPDGVLSVTQKEVEILLYLVEHRNKVVKRDELLLNVWGKNDYFLGRSMDVFMSKIRKYLKADETVQLETIHGIGFRLNIQSA